MNWHSVKGHVASLVTVVASSVTLILPILISNPDDAKIVAAGPVQQDVVDIAARQVALPKDPPALDTEITARLVPLPATAVSKKLMSFIATAYSLRGITSSGVEVMPGIVAADPAVLPIGSIIRIHSPDCPGIYTVLDTGANLRGRMIDFYMRTKREAVQFGARRVKVELLRRGRGPKVAGN